MKVEYCYNYNEASGSRGMNPDVSNEISSFEAATVEEAVKGIYEDLFGFDDLEDLEYATEGDYTPEYLVQYAEDQDVTGGDTILFWFAIDGQRYETQWMDSIEEFYNDEEGNGVNVNFLATWRPDDDTDDVDIIECDDIVEAIDEMVKRTRFEGVGTGTVIINITDDDGESIDDDEAEEIVGYDDFETMVTFTNEDGLWNNTGDFTSEYSKYIYNNGEDELLESKKKTNKKSVKEDIVRYHGADMTYADLSDEAFRYCTDRFDHDRTFVPGWDSGWHDGYGDPALLDEEFGKFDQGYCAHNNYDVGPVDYYVQAYVTATIIKNGYNPPFNPSEECFNEWTSKFKDIVIESKKPTSKKKVNEAGASFGETFAMGEAEFAKWLNATKGMTALEVYNEPDIGCTLVYIKDSNALGGIRHIGTYNHDRQVLFCDDVKYFGRVIESRKNMKKRIDEDAGEKLNQIFQKGDLYINPNDVEVSVVDVGDNDVTYKTKIPGKPIEDAFCSDQGSAMNFLTANGYVKQLPQDNAAEAEQEEVAVVESAKKKNRKLKEDTRFVDSASWIKDNISDDDFEDFADFCDDVFGVDFTYEDPNALWSISELNEMKRAWLEEQGEDVGTDPDLHVEYNEDGSMNLEMAYNNWLSLEGSDPDVSNYDAFMAGAALFNVVPGDDLYSEWLDQFEPNFDVSNYDAFQAGAECAQDYPAIDNFDAATPYKDRTTSWEEDNNGLV